ncbi:MAG: N-acetyltransferase [Tannerella sp.]|jgi:predicted GNAT family acetyltransferase|nr:N-acetyltransferase [Tannerella sp.]
MEIKHSKTTFGGEFAAFIDNEQAGLISYLNEAGGVMALEHTEVDDRFRGQSVGKIILLEIVDFARKNGLKIKPVCPFIVSMFKRYEDIRDVLQD